MPNGVQSLKYDTLSLTGDPIRLNDRTVEWRNGGMTEYHNAQCLVVWNKRSTKIELQWIKKVIYDEKGKLKKG